MEEINSQPQLNPENDPQEASEKTSEKASEKASGGGETTGPTHAELAIANTAYNIDRELAGLGWDQAPALFALVKTANLLEQDIPEEVRISASQQVADDPNHYTAVLQDIDTDLLEKLPQIWWPENVDGTAVAIERVVLPPSAEADIPADPKARDEFLANHPDRDEVRVVVAVLRDGESWCTLRARSADTASKVAGGAMLVPDLVKALWHTFEADEA